MGLVSSALSSRNQRQIIYQKIRIVTETKVVFFSYTCEIIKKVILSTFIVCQSNEVIQV